MSDLFKDLKNSSNLITGHINPDGDALGSALAFKLILDRTSYKYSGSTFPISISEAISK